MADNKLLPPTGTGTANITVATDEIGGVDYQRIKVDWGPNNTATDVDATPTAAMPVADVGTATNASGQVTVTNSSTTIVSARTTAPARRAVIIANYQTVPVYIDPSGATATTSDFRLDPGAALTLETAAAITGITSSAYSASGDAKVHYIELY